MVSTGERPNRALFIAPAFAPYCDNSPYSTLHFLQQVAQDLRSRGARVSLAGLSGSASTVFDEVVTFEGAPQPNWLVSRGSTASDCTSLQRMVDFALDGIACDRYDAVINFSHDPEPMRVTHPRFINVATFHRGLSPETDVAIERTVGRGHIVFLARSHARQYTSLEVPICGCPVSVPDPRALDPGWSLPPPRRLPLFAGRICEEKGVRTALAVARRLGMPIRFAGLAQDPSLVRDIERAGCIYMGALPRCDLFRAMSESSVLLLTQCEEWGEAFGMVTAEALACGLPAVALDRGANADVIEPVGGGAVLRERLPEADIIEWLAAKTIELGRCDGVQRRRLSRRARRNFSARKVADRLVAVWKQRS